RQASPFILLVGRQNVIPCDQQEANALLGPRRADTEIERLHLVALVAALLEMDRERQLDRVPAPVAGRVDGVRPLVPAELERMSASRDVECRRLRVQAI